MCFMCSETTHICFGGTSFQIRSLLISKRAAIDTLSNSWGLVNPSMCNTKYHFLAYGITEMSRSFALHRDSMLSCSHVLDGLAENCGHYLRSIPRRDALCKISNPASKNEEKWLSFAIGNYWTKNPVSSYAD